MTYDKLVSLLRCSVKPTYRPVVLISGGLDSTILLHHLTELTTDPIHTVHIHLPEESENLDAWKVAEYYGSKHTEVEATNILEEYAKFIPDLDRPRFNLWPLYGHREAAKLGCVNIYVGEGLDEHFGGYWYKPRVSYPEYWGGVVEHSLPVHRFFAKRFGLTLQTPFIDLPVTETRRYWFDPHDGEDKRALRRAYRGIIPGFVLEKRKAPGRVNWEKPSVWMREFLELGPVPKSHEEANMVVNRWAMRLWLGCC